LIKTNANGDTLWTKTYGGADHDEGHSVQQTTDGGYIITGFTFSFGIGTINVYLIKTDANGDTLWTKTYGGYGDDEGYDIQQTTDSGYIITGATGSFGAGGSDIYLIKTKSNGDTLWTKIYGESFFDEGLSVQQTNDGSYIIAGYTSSFGSSQSYGGIYLIKTDANGNSGCYQSNANTIVASTNTIVGNTNTIVRSGGTVSPTNMIVGSGGNDSTLCLSTGINELNIENSITLYPNPASNELRIQPVGWSSNGLKNAELGMTKATIYIMNTLGQDVSTAINVHGPLSEVEVEVRKRSSGLYFVRIANEKEVWVGKFVKE